MLTVTKTTLMSILSKGEVSEATTEAKEVAAGRISIAPQMLRQPETHLPLPPPHQLFRRGLAASIVALATKV